MMQKFQPFMNDSQSLAIDELTLENQGEQVNLYGSLTLTIDKDSLSYAKELQRIINEVVQYLEDNNAQDIDKQTIIEKQQEKITEVTNPFA